MLDKLAKIKSAFRKSYAAMLDGVLARRLPTAICTIYEANYPDLTTRAIAATGLSVFNDAILREAFARALPVIDLRLIINDGADYANDIEPSVEGGEDRASDRHARHHRRLQATALCDLRLGSRIALSGSAFG